MTNQNIKKIITILSSITFFFLFSGESVFAKENFDNENAPHIEYALEITNNNTGEKKVVSVKDEDIKLSMIELSQNVTGFNTGFATQSYSNTGEDEKIYSGYVEIDASEVLAETFDLPTIQPLNLIGDSSLTKNKVIIRAGLTFSTNARDNTVKILRVHGSTSSTGLYYVVKRNFYWRNPGSGKGTSATPTVTSWNYAVTDNWGLYNSSLRPFALLEAVIDVPDMSGGSETISVTYSLQS